jgi:hypothetical protein
MRVDKTISSNTLQHRRVDWGEGNKNIYYENTRVGLLDLTINECNRNICNTIAYCKLINEYCDRLINVLCGAIVYSNKRL